jgi:hypothetical protein
MAREEQCGVVRNDALFGQHPVLAVERCATVETFIQYDADAPQITATIVRLAHDDFRSHILTRTDDASCKLAAFGAVPPVEKPFSFRVLFYVPFIARRCPAGHSQVLISIAVRGGSLGDIVLISCDLDPKLFQEILTMVGVVCLAVRPMSIERKAKIRYFEMTRGADQEVVRFDVSVNPVHLVSFVDAKDHLCHVLSGNSLVEYVLS